MFRKNTASQFIHFQGVDATTGGIKSGVTWTIRRCIDGTFAAATGTVTEDSTNGWYKFAMSQADTNGNNIGFNFTGTGAVPQTVNIITDGSPPDINLKNAAGTAVTLDANNVLNVSAKYVGGTLQTARDIGLSVLLSAGTGTGQLDFTSGVVKANLAQILGTALTETAGLIAAGFKQFFNIASPTSTMNTITTVTTATTATNLTNAPTNGDFTAAMKTSLNNATPAVTVSDKTGFSLSAAGVQAIWDALTSALTTVGSIGKLLVTNIDAAISSRGTSTLTQTQVTGGAYSVQSASCVLGDARIAHLDADVSTRLAASSYTAPDNTSVTAIKTQTDKLTFTVANQLDVNIQYVNDVQVNGVGSSGNPWGP